MISAVYMRKNNFPDAIHFPYYIFSKSSGQNCLSSAYMANNHVQQRQVKAQRNRDMRICGGICGGNADPVKLAPLLAAAPPYPKGALGC